MIHKLYSAYDLPADHDTCHLFEHLIIRRFLKETEKVGGNRAFVGELDGDDNPGLLALADFPVEKRL